MKRVLSFMLIVLFCTIAVCGTYVSADTPSVSPAARTPTQVYLQGSEFTACAIDTPHGALLIKGSLSYAGSSTLIPDKRIKLYKKKWIGGHWAPTWTFVKNTRTTDTGQILTYINVPSGAAWKYKAVFEGTRRLAPSRNTTCYSFT